MTERRLHTASPADLARLKRQLEDSGEPRPSARRPRSPLFEYAFLGHVRTREERRLATGEPDLFDQLKALAEKEDWDGLDARFEGEQRILRSYLDLTFEQVQSQGNVLVSADEAYSAFNTGLSTERQETIYGVFRRNRVPGRQSWYFLGWFEESARIVLDNFPELPDFATYTEEPADFIYDWHRELKVNVRHVIEENVDRLPESLRTDLYGAELRVAAAVERARKRVRRNYKAAVPFWYPAHRQVQLLLPLSLLDPASVDLALVVSRQGEYYRGHTALTIGMAYSNARLLARPDSDWLRPAAAADDGADEV